MGNRAFVIFEEDGEISPAVYLHWNGGPESVYPFLDELDRRQVRADIAYAPARFIAVVAEFMDQEHYTGLSLGVMNGPEAITIDALDPFNHGDNGVFVVTRGNGERRIRRFVPGSKLAELSPEDTEREKREAYNHPYSAGDETIKALFTKSAEYT